MNKKILISCAFILIVGIYWVVFDGSGQVVTLTILHLNDNESQLLHAGNGIEDFGGAARVVTVVKNLRSAAATDVVLTLSSGDNFLAGPEFKASLAAHNPALGGVNTYYDAKALDAIGYDAILLGNHDFDFGPDLLTDFISTGFTNTFPRYLSANIDFTGEPALQVLVERGRIAKSIIIEKNGHTFGIIGATTPNLPFISRPANVVVDSNLVTVVQNEINALLNGGINKIIFVSHLQDLAEDKALIAQLSGVDIAITGGSNDVLANPGDLLLPGDTSGGTYPIVMKDLSGRKISIVTTGGEYKYVGRLIVDFDKTTGEITRNEGNPAGSGTGRFAHVAGFSFEYDPSRQAIEIDNDGNIATPGRRVTGVILDDETILIDDGSIVVDPTYSLAIVTVNFLARGGDQYPFRDLPFTNLYITYQQALSNYIRQGLDGVITGVDYPEGGKDRIARLPDTNPP
jgi:5'-nucleotidase